MKKILLLFGIVVSIASFLIFDHSFQSPVSAEIQILGDYIQQTLVSKDGQRYWYRTCPINPSSAASVAEWGNCTPYQGPITIDELNLPNYTNGNGIRDISGHIVTIQDQPYLHQSLVSFDGKTIWSRSCPVKNSIEWENCLPTDTGGIWTTQKIADFKLPGGTNTSIINLSELAITLAPIDLGFDLEIDPVSLGLLTQMLVGDDGNMWVRFCTTNPTVGIDTCQSWMRENISEMTTGAPIGAVEDIEDFSMYAIQKANNNIELSISLLHSDGDHAYTQTCDVNPSDALSADLSAESSDMQSVFGCSTEWKETRLSTLFIPPDGFGETFTSFNTYAYQTLHPMVLCELKEDGDISCDGVKDKQDHRLWWTEHTGVTSSSFADLDNDKNVTGSDFELLRQKHFDTSPNK